GALDAAQDLLAVAELCSLDSVQRTQLGLLRARVMFALRRGRDSVPALFDAARLLQPLDGALARDAYLEALGAAIYGGRLTGRDALRELAESARPTLQGLSSQRPTDLLLDGLATLFTEGYAAAVSPLRRALSAFREVAGPREDNTVRWLFL